MIYRFLPAFILAFGFWAAAGSAAAQPPAHQPNPQRAYVTLKECVAIALKNRQAIRDARFAIRSAQQDVRAILAVAHPQLSASWDFNWFVAIPQQPVPAAFANPMASPNEFITVKFGTDYNTSLGLNASQLVFDWTYFIGLKATRMITELQSRNLLRTEHEAVAEVTKAYYTVLVSRERARQLALGIEQLENLMAVVRLQTQQGVTEGIELSRLQVQLNNLRTQVANANALSELTIEVLKFQTGLQPEITLIPTDTLPTSNAQAAELLAREPDAHTRVEYQMLEVQHTLNGYNARRYRAAYLPALYAFGSYKVQTFSNEIGTLYDPRTRWFPQSVVGLSLSWKFYDGFANAARAQQARIAQAQNQSQMAELERSVALQVSQARISLENAQRNIDAQRENLALAQEIYRVTRQKYEQGLGNNLQTLDAETQVRTAQTSYTDALLQFQVAMVDLQNAHGILYQPADYAGYEIDMAH